MQTKTPFQQITLVDGTVDQKHIQRWLGGKAEFLKA